MKIILKDDNKEAEVKLEEGESFYWKLSLQAGGQAGGKYGLDWKPPYYSCGLITRLWHQCYLLASLEASARGHNSVKLNLPGQNDFFHELKLDPGQRFFINCAHLVGFSFSKGGGLESQRKRLVSLSCWLIGHPLPVIASGPGIIYWLVVGLRKSDYSKTQVCRRNKSWPLTPRRSGLFVHRKRTTEFSVSSGTS